MAGTKNDILVGKNADFSQAGAPNGTSGEANGLITNGQVWIGSTALNAGGTHINVGSFTSPDSSLTFGYSSPNITCTVTGGSTVGKTITGNTGGALSPSSGNWNILGSHGINTSGSGSTLTAAINNAITLGDLSNLGSSAALTISTGKVVITAGNIDMPNTNSGGSQGIINYGGSAMLSNFGTASVFLGVGSGNATNTGSYNTGVGFNALPAISSGQANTMMGRLAGGGAFTTASFCTGLGANALFNCASDYNTGVGANSMFCSVGNTGTGNTFVGYATGFNLTSADYNAGFGYQALSNLTTGDYNIAIGKDAGTSYNGAESSNILLQNAGTNGESNVIRIGTAGSGSGQQNLCYIAGINGVTVTGSAVLCATDGKLGTVVSSARYKNNIQDMGNVSVLNLRPVEFSYKSDKTNSKQYGLIAEEIDKDFPYLCLYDSEGKPESVKYHELPVFLLKEIQRLNARIAELEKRM